MKKSKLGNGSGIDNDVNFTRWAAGGEISGVEYVASKRHGY